MGRDNGDPMMDSLKPQPGQYDSYRPKFHPLPGDWAKEQLQRGVTYRDTPETNGLIVSSQTEIERALAAERAQHEYWEKWQGVTPGKAVYENPRESQNTLLPTAKYGTQGR